MELLTRAEIFKIIGWIIAIIVPIILYRWNSKELKESEKKQERRMDDLWQKLQKETRDRMELAKKTVEDEKEEWKFLYHQEKKRSEETSKILKETQEKYHELLRESGNKENELEFEIIRVRRQLEEKGLFPEEHDIADNRKQQEAIQEIEAHWDFNQRNGKINKRIIIAEVLGESWKKDLKNKKGGDIIEWRNRLIRLIYEEVDKSIK